MRTLLTDLRGQVYSERGHGFEFWCRVFVKSLLSPAAHAVVLFRVASALARTPLRPFGYLLRTISVVWSGAEIHPDAQIGPGLTLVHSVGVVIGGEVRIGRDCRVHQGVTFGEAGRGATDNSSASPVVGDHVTVGAHAVVLGACRIGNDVIIGANSVVTKDLPDGAVAVGSPARVIRIQTDEEISRA